MSRQFLPHAPLSASTSHPLLYHSPTTSSPDRAIIRFTGETPLLTQNWAAHRHLQEWLHSHGNRCITSARVKTGTRRRREMSKGMLRQVVARR